jgi:ubiquinone/menaquinone biosynthesis C-methylase UbiE
MAKGYYLETAEKLRIRIQAHTQFTEFKLEDWLLGQLGRAEGCRLLEIGCGDGNFFPTYARALGREGLIVGMDVNKDLVAKAGRKGKECGTPTRVAEWDFDNHPYPLSDGEMNYIIAPFSAYYSKDVPAWVADSLRVLKRGGLLLLLGPTHENARELYVLNELVTGIGHIPETDDTSNKLETEFLGVLQRIPALKVEKAVLDRDIVFPTPEAFAKYYFATWLYEKTQEKVDGPIPFDKVVEAVGKVGLRLNKKVIAITARKS